ncbi:di-heme oxidoredictase family protein [Vibrio agarivorans]|uniref:Di-heme oxidoredictase family protein n=1 Tax=Vibrio agarivorans TaxID=153622 RepID=A0ABT7Y0E6_9VIBR|nr:di-heme oxidoredictase family protein [Vibrio agarivorans]MDN2481457.1 di-heme oxidoredictase family protein [Vibrio agarivorans]
MKFHSLFLPLMIVSTTLFASNEYSGGQTTTSKQGPNAYSQPATNLSMLKRLDFSVGNSFFRNPWVQAPASTDARDGLGPLFNTNGCQNCHIKDGRGHAPSSSQDNAISMLIRLSVPAQTSEQEASLIKGGNIPEPTYGGQLQDFSLPGGKPEGRVVVTYTEHKVTFDDGNSVMLRKPDFTISDLAYGPMHPKTELSPRVAPVMIGLGLLESISEQTLLDWSDEQDSDADGISGRVNKVWDIQQQKTVIGRFGWKAGQPSLMQQNAAAFHGDLGLTSHLFPRENCTANQTECLQYPSGGDPEVSKEILDFVEFYSQHLAVPKRRNIGSSQVLEGEALFEQIGCDTCHKSSAVTAKREDRPALSEQKIAPYTDLLLHDMGQGLADHRGEFLATGTEWRTPPLWGLGYLKEVNGHSELLHDGRARNVMEAILWHGGEAKQSRDKVVTLSKAEREALVAFLHSL